MCKKEHFDNINNGSITLVEQILSVVPLGIFFSTTLIHFHPHNPTIYLCPHVLPNDQSPPHVVIHVFYERGKERRIGKKLKKERRKSLKEEQGTWNYHHLISSSSNNLFNLLSRWVLVRNFVIVRSWDLLNHKEISKIHDSMISILD